MIKYKKIYCLVIMVLCMLHAGIKVHATEQEKLLQYLEALAQEGPVYEVIPNGTGDFSSIQEAVEQVASGSTLLIYQGIYEENVEIVDKTVNLIGADRENCILIANTANYDRVPLSIGAGVVYNMTICGSNPDKKNMAPLIEVDYDRYDLNSIYDYQDQFPGYAIHIEQDYTYGRELLIEGCRIISNSNYCVGIGCRGNSAITFADCQLYSNGGGCVYLHNIQSESGNGDAYFTMKDCELKNYSSPYVMSVYSTGDINPIYLTFQNVRVSTVAYEAKDSYVKDNMNTWYTVEQLASPVVQKLLETEGYYTPLGRDLIHYCDTGMCASLLIERTQESLLGTWPELSEGIHYISKIDSLDNYMASGIVFREKTGKCQVIEIKNIDFGKNILLEASLDGWCGLRNIYLTEESYGNTLIEMNYPRKIMNEGVE